MLKLPQLWLPGELVLEPAGLAVPVRGAELQGCQRLGRVLIQDQPFVSNDGGGKPVLCKG